MLVLVFLFVAVVFAILLLVSKLMSLQTPIKAKHCTEKTPSKTDIKKLKLHQRNESQRLNDLKLHSFLLRPLGFEVGARSVS